MRIFTDPFTILDAKAAAGIGAAFEARSFRHLVVQLATASTATLTVKVQGSLSDTCPDFTSAASATNPWVYLNTVDYLSNSVVAGGTGYAFTGTDGVKMFEVNTNGLKWLNLEVSGYSAGKATAVVIGFNDI